jgi:hypothetical protein
VTERRPYYDPNEDRLFDEDGDVRLPVKFFWLAVSLAGLNKNLVRQPTLERALKVYAALAPLLAEQGKAPVLRRGRVLDCWVIRVAPLWPEAEAAA